MEQKFLEKYEILNTEQKQAVDTIEGPVFVMAGPGTGKTQILTLRIANILRTAAGIEPENILALTFTNAAAYNMRERLATFTGPEIAHRVHISTFHSFAEEMMKRYADLFERSQPTRLVSGVEQVEIIEKLLDRVSTKSFSVFKRRNTTLGAIVSALGKIKSEGLTPDEFREHVLARYELDLASDDIRYKRKYGEYNAGDIKPSELAKLNRKRDKNLDLALIYEAYRDELASRSLYDHSDIILRMVHELSEGSSSFKAELQEQFQYILVDEHQDTNDGQNAIIEQLIDHPMWESRPNLFVVGDAKQAIYRFAGASEESYTRLLSLLRDPLVIHLEKNYRSSQEVLDYAHGLIQKSDHHKTELELDAFFDYQGDIAYREFSNDKMELLWVVQDIKARIEKGEDPSGIAILYRNNKDADDLRRLLDIYALLYRDFSRKNILKDPDIQKLFYLLLAVDRPTDNESLAKALFIDFLPFDVFDVERILDRSRNAKGEYNRSIITILEDEKFLTSIGVTEERRKPYRDFVEFLRRSKRASEEGDALSFLSDFVRESGFLNYILGHPQSVLALQKLEKLFDELKKESFARGEFSFKDSIHYLMTMKRYNMSLDVVDTLGEGIQLMTFHGSKGLEFDTVYIVRALKKKSQSSEISLPFGDFKDGVIEDERRLFYVALTRARKNCLISSYLLNEEGREKARLMHIDEMDGLSRIDMSAWEKEHRLDGAKFFAVSYEHLTSLVDPEYLRQKFFQNNLSVSALNNYVESPLKYFFRNLIYLPEARSPFLDKGNLVHETLEQYFNSCLKDQTILGKDVLEQSFKKVLANNSRYEEHRDIAWEILSLYFDHYADSFEIPIENEKRINRIPFELEGGETLFLSGVMDKITMNDEGEITVWDYKTGKAYSEMSKERKKKIHHQAAFYKLLLQHAFNGKYNFHRAVFDFVEPNAHGEYERKEFSLTQADVDEVREIISKLAQKILDGTLLEGNFYQDETNRELLEFLEVLRGPEIYEQKELFS